MPIHNRTESFPYDTLPNCIENKIQADAFKKRSPARLACARSGGTEMLSRSKSCFVAAIAASVCIWTSPGPAQTSTKSGSRLTIKGTAGADLLIVTGSTSGAITVTNDRNHDVKSFSGVQKLNIDLAGGNDSLILTNIDLDQGLVAVKLGAGDDSLTANGGHIDASFSVDGEAGNDDITILGPVSGDVSLFGGPDQDAIDLNGGAEIGGDLDIDAQSGEDEVTYYNVTVFGATRINLGSGNDFAACMGGLFLGEVDLSAGAGNDQVYHNSNVYSGGDVVVDLQGGDDRYLEDFGAMSMNYYVDGGPGMDDFIDSNNRVQGVRTTRRVE